jgi:hypothetical protein
MSTFANRYDPPKTDDEQAASDLEFEEMLEMSEEDRDRLVDVEMRLYVEARNAASPQHLYRCDRHSALGSCIRARNIIRNWYVGDDPVPADHFTREMLRSAQMRLVRLRASRAVGHARSAVQ